MANMTAMAAGAPAGGPMGMMMPAGAGPAPMPNNALSTRANLHTCIYEYFLNQGMYDAARSLLQTPDSEVRLKNNGGDGNLANGVNDDSMDTDSKDDADSKRPSDLPLASSNSNFLYEWFCLFWDMQVAVTKRNHSNTAVGQFLQHTQQQNRLRQNQQQELLRSMRPDGAMFNQNPMMRNMPNSMQMQKQPNLARTAMANNTNNPQAMQMLQKQGQMQQNAADLDANRRPGSPGSAENAPSPNKRPRLDGAGPFNPQQQAAMMQNGQRPQQGMPGQQVPNTPANTTAQAQQLLLTNGINPSQLTPQQFQQFQNQPPHAQIKSIQAYSQNLQQHHGQQMPNKPAPNPNGPQGQGSPMMAQGPDGANLNAYYHPGEMGGPTAMRPGAPGAQGAGGSNHALQDYQMQLMLLEQQNKKRLMMARQEQDSMGNMPRADGQPGPAGAPGPNGQAFQDTSPQAARTGTSPNPSEQMKRGTPQMNSAGIPSPLPEGANSRGSPNPMSFMPNNMDPNMAPHFFKGMNGMENNMGNVQMNGGMRPPSSHPGQPGFNGQMTPQMAAAARQQGGQAPGMQWQGQPNGNGMAPGGPQGQVQGTPQQRAMPPPSAPATGAAANATASGRATASPQQGNAAPPTPQQSNKAAPKKKDTKNAKTKAAATKKANANTGATPASETAQDQEPPTPATPITPASNANFPKGPNAAGTAATTAPPAPAAPVAAPQPDPNQMGTFGMENPAMDFNMDFANPNMTENVLQDFDFDSFLHDDADGANFGFDPSAFGMEGAGEIGAD
ncbi:uncharacterized protein B0I36DRAFT_348905 [Microdochium trichocladiopsis]|uniref:LisH domain-containing protein n=1 Tax=Microdochium trichocladiopsis TaxID=1682393 RepID=A0A9P8Y827_9PEZI|nr:uncharacterized protein B0I36DRAFT_348905 [Microdochium trichocladiopsis]KAH7030711.1 hypothetical protein B0I36DRAFT_348905 [Microdochium trichocladiopsis]